MPNIVKGSTTWKSCHALVIWRRSLNTIAYLKKSLFGQENSIYRRLLGKNRGLWRHFGDTRCQGIPTLCSPENWGRFGGDISLFDSFCLRQYCSRMHFAFLATRRWRPIFVLQNSPKQPQDVIVSWAITALSHNSECTGHIFVLAFFCSFLTAIG